MSKRAAAGKPTLVEDIMSTKLVSAKADSSAREVAQLMAEKGVSSVIIKDDGKIVGIITERDLARNVCAKDGKASKTPATAIMSMPVQTISKSSAVEVAAKMMADGAIRHLAVENGDKIAGMVTATDLARHLRKRLDVSGPELEILTALYWD
jgi:signal-transduction protein with cAMP-binding, CBS, and nucleotidyltransferase domain